MPEQEEIISEEAAPSILPPPPLMPGATGYQTAAPARPLAVTIIGIVLLVFAAIGLSAFIVGIVMRQTPSAVSANMLLLSRAISVITITLEITMGIGLLAMAPWARMGTIVMLIFNFVAGYSVSSVITFTSLEIMAAAAPATSAGNTFMMVKYVTIGAFIFGFLFTIGLYSIAIFFLTRPNVKLAFEQRRR